MAINSGPGKPHVANASKPQGGSRAGATKGTPQATVSVGKMPDSAGGVTLGTTHNQHHVAHRLSSSGPTTGSLKKGQ